MKNTCVRGLAMLSFAGGVMPAMAEKSMKDEKRPNFVWFMAEDISAHYLNLYTKGKDGAKTPNVNVLAREGILFNNAFCNAPVSSAARSTLITGCYATRLGASFHRKLEEVPLPEGLNMFPSYLRKAGYHTSNAAKTDYNCFIDSTAWDVVSGKMGEWRNRPDKNMPFFFVRTNAVTHEGQLQFDSKKMKNTVTRYDPATVKVHPYHPDTELFRYTYATFYDRIEDSDVELGKLMNMLRQDGELDNTFIFYFGDNGGALPGTKGYTGETGLHVPLVVYVPKKWRDRLPVKIGEKTNGFVSFVDFGPTLLHLAGIKVPEEMDGKPFLGEDISAKTLNARDETYGYGDRFDELYAFNRTVRKGNLKYSRNFEPYHPKSLFVDYRYKQAAFREWKELYMNGQLNQVQSRFFEPQGAEELYDLSQDPYETHNLAADAEYQDQLKQLRGLLKRKLMTDMDLGFFPECVWLEEGRKNPTAFALANKNRIERYAELADLQMLSFQEASSEIIKALSSPDPVERYWGATVCASFGSDAVSLVNHVKTLLDDSDSYVRSRAIVFLAQNKLITPLPLMKEALRRSKSGAESLLILNDIAYLKDAGLATDFQLTMSDIPQKCTGVDLRLDYLNANKK
ncbi:MAG: sulfatase-like hydrolase/transferase [Bacteroidales bacterium]|nr:sulfatase-like hydrolase/transferase [Bacteroidales bacterium]